MTVAASRDALVESLCGDLSAIRAPRGTELNARSWQTEAPLRMLLNNLDREVAERPEELVVYGGSGKAARNHECSARARPLAARPRRRRDAARPERQARRRVPDAPGRAARTDRERDARAALGDVGRVPPPGGARADDVRSDDGRQLDLHRHPGDPAGHVPDVRRRGREALRRRRPRRPNGADRGPRRDGRGAAARSGHARCAPSSASRSTPPGWSGGSRPATSTRRPTRSTRRSRACAPPRPSGRGLSVGLLGNAADVVPELARRGEHFDLVTDQTAAHDPLTGYIPQGLSVEDAARLREAEPDEYMRRAGESIAVHVRGMLDHLRAGSHVFDYGNNLRGEAQAAGVEDAFAYPGFVPAYIRPLFCRGNGPFRWAVLSGDPADIAAIDDELRALFPDDAILQRWLALARERVAFQGLPARICWLGYGDRARAGLAINELVRSGRVQRAGRDRPRPPRLRLGRLAVPRDRVDARRLGCDRRLADPERARSTRRRARPGSASTTAAASGSATRSTRGWSSSRTGPTTRRSASSGC